MKIDLESPIESRRDCTRYPVLEDDGSGTEESVWVCDFCGSEECDPYEHGCYECHADEYEAEFEEAA